MTSFSSEVIIMLIGNSNADQGLINVLRLLVTYSGENIITSKLIHCNIKVLVPCINLKPNPTIPNDKKTFNPIKLAVTMKINKAQGKMHQRASLYLIEPLFSYRQVIRRFSTSL